MLVGSAANMTCVVGVVLMNKYMQLQHKFNSLVFLSFCHFAFTAVGMRVLLVLRVFRYKAARTASVAPVALGSLSSVAFMNLSLKYNSVGFYQMSKLACIPVTVLLSWAVYGERLSLATIASLVPLVWGLYVAQAHDYSANTLGTTYAGVAVVATVLCQIFTSSYQRMLKCDSNQLLYHTSPLISLGMLVLCPVFEFDFCFGFADVDWNHDLKSDIFASCCLALGANVTNYYVLGRTSALTFQVISHLKTILTILFSVTVLGFETNAEHLFGITIAMLGVMSYTEVKRRAAIRSVKHERRRRKDAVTPGGTTAEAHPRKRGQADSPPPPLRYSECVPLSP